MTLFYLEIEPQHPLIRWVRAGHDPALLFDPQQDRFEDLDGPGLALGIQADYPYAMTAKQLPARSQVIVVGTDGVWEAQNDQGQIMGKQALKDVVRAHAAASAQVILDAILHRVQAHRNGAPAEDDATLVVIKIERKKTFSHHEA